MKKELSLTQQHKTKLLKLAREAINHYMFNRQFLEPSENEFQDEVFQQVVGNFVTINKDSQLRGCIGNIEGVEPLFQGVVKNAVNAGFYDPRFSR